MDRYTIDCNDIYDAELDPEGMWVMYSDASAEIALQRNLLQNIAALAHSGGCAELGEFEAMCAVRRLTVKYWNSRQSEIDQRAAVIIAIQASKQL